MVNALHSSRAEGTKQFTLDGKTFGWKAIIDMFERDCGHVRNGHTRMIPKLWEAHII